MSLVLKVSAGGVPAGAYAAKFLGVEPQPADPVRGYAAGLRWIWEVTSGPQAGQKCGRITTATPTAKNAAGKIVAGLLGRAIVPDESIDLAPCVGKPYVLVVAAGEGGGTRVESVAPAPTA